MEHVRDAVRDAVRSEMLKQINPQKQVDEGFAADMANIVTTFLGAGVAIGGLIGGVVSGNPLIGFGVFATGMAVGVTGGAFLRHKINNADFRRLLANLEKSIIARDRVLEKGSAIPSGEDQQAYLQAHEAELKSATLKQKKAAEAMRKFLSLEKAHDTVLGSLTRSERNYVEKMITAGENGLITGNLNLAGKVY